MLLRRIHSEVRTNRSRVSGRRLRPVAAAILLACCAAFGARWLGSTPALGAGKEILGAPWTGEPGITETVAGIMRRQELAPRDDSVQFRETHPEIEVDLKKVPDPLSPRVPRWPSSAPLSPSIEGALAPQTPGVSFLALKSGPAASESNFIPPDSMGDVGPTQILAVANGRIRVFDRNGVLGPLNVTTDVFFASVRNGQGTTDPHIRYDRLTGRWFVVMVNVPTPNRVLIAVSSGPVITGQSSFTFFQFQQNLPTPAGDNGRFADYPTLGLDRFALYIGANMFATTLADTTAFVVNKANLLAGTLTVTAFRGLTGGLNDGPISPQGVNNDDPQATSGYIIGVDVAFFGRIDILRVNNPGGVPSLTRFTLLVPSTSNPLPQVALGSAVPLDALDDRLFAAEIRRNKITGSKSLWTAHNIAVDFSGVGGPAGDRNGARWYEIGTLDTTPTLVQSGTLFDTAVANPRGHWMNSVAASGQGHMALGTSFAGASEFAGVAVAGRLRTAPPGTTAASTIAQPGLDVYDQPASNSGRNRWGDYSQTVVDPTDDMTLWTFQEYAELRPAPPSVSPGTWGVRVVQLRAPQPATPSNATPAFVPRNTPSATLTVTGTSVAGSEFFDPGPDTGGPGYANHITASMSGGVTVGSTTFNSPTQVTLGISTVGATCGTKDVTVTNPDAQSRTGTGLMTTTPPAPSAANNGPICSGQSLQLSATSAVSGVTYAWTGPNGFVSSEQNPVIGGAGTSASGTYSVTVSIGGCASSPGTTGATVKQTPVSTASNDGPACEGATVELSASTVSGASYSWTGPNGFTSSQQNPVIGGITPSQAGTYTLIVTLDGCSTSPLTTTVSVSPEGGACSDGLPCTTNDVCGGGSCAGQPVVCTAIDSCHDAGTCDPQTGACSNPSKPDGTECNDGNVCTTADACAAGICAGGQTLRCDDFNDCTGDTCDPQSGCLHTPQSGNLCDDHDSCTADDRCSSGACAGTPIPPPGEVAGVRLNDLTTIVWAPAGAGSIYDVTRGNAGQWPVGSGAAETCLASGTTDETATDTDTPATGMAFWYLVRTRNGCGTGNYGAASDGTPRLTTACP